jgi:hypothetical protein
VLVKLRNIRGVHLSITCHSEQGIKLKI